MHIFPGNIYYYRVRRSKKNMAKLNGHSVSSIRTYVPRVMLSRYYHLPPPPGAFHFKYRANIQNQARAATGAASRTPHPPSSQAPTSRVFSF